MSDSRETLDPALERAARAAFGTYFASWSAQSWEMLPEAGRRVWRNVARAVLAEAGQAEPPADLLRRVADGREEYAQNAPGHQRDTLLTEARNPQRACRRQEKPL